VRASSVPHRKLMAPGNGFQHEGAALAKLRLHRGDPLKGRCGNDSGLSNITQ